MNESQFEAFKYALTSDLAVIQGPPGTGKSYIGAEIAKFLLNKNNWKAINPDKNDERPLLVVCYTNHALDQFLTQIAGFVNENDIVRVGSRYPLLYEISKNLEYLIQLENRLASKEALCLSENYNRIANNILFSKLSTDDDIVKWLITYKETIENEYFFDIDIIRKLVGWEIAEIKAKNIYAHVCKNNMKMDAATMYQKFKSSKTLPSHLENEKSKNWPKLAHIDELKELGELIFKIQGYPEKLAIEILASAKNNIQLIRLEHKSIMAVNKFEKSYFVEIFKVKLKLVEEYLKNKNITKETESLENFDITEKQNEEIELQTDRGWQYPKELEPYRHIILQALPMKDNDAYAENDIWKLSLLSRWSLYQYWISESQKARKREISAAEKQYRHTVKLLNEQKTIVDGEIMKYAKVIGMTTTGAAKLQSTLRSIKPRIVMAEEAAEVFEAHIVTSLTEACEHLILIGDHKQLRPNPAVYELAKKFNMNISLFERLIKNNFPFKMLNFQWRMRNIYANEKSLL
uniref:DNA2/NAM7 helicase helicase domain-containing protein n=1 Tax=Panagrolaimus superbus TaxID=310955 RepID=A0A914Z141_9BILA